MYTLKFTKFLRFPHKIDLFVIVNHSNNLNSCHWKFNCAPTGTDLDSS